MEKKSNKVIVVGAGAAGLMAAYSAALQGNQVTLLEKNEKAGKKIYITGKGRCNVTNAADIEELFDNIISNKKFLFSALYGFDNWQTMDFFEQHGVPLKIERGNRVFPVSDKSMDIINGLLRALRSQGVDIRYHQEVSDLLVTEQKVPEKAAMKQEETGQRKTEKKAAEKKMKDQSGPEQKVSGVILTDGTKIQADAVIMATGGVSYPVTGSDGAGMRMLSQHGHTITPLRPALVPMNVQEEYCRELQGLSLKNVGITIISAEKKKKKPLYEGFGEMLFTHFGVSGPLILSASSIVGKELIKGPLTLKIDFKPALSIEQLDDRILRDFQKQINRNFGNALDELLPKKMIPVMIAYCGISPYTKVHEITKEERRTLVNAVKAFPMTLISLRGWQEAIITQGGLQVKEFDPGTMESKKIKNLYAAGEILDVDALTGGFNLQVAWSTGYLAGRNVLKERNQN